jgi:phosphoglycolate phosphatase-like HAD superfamily hydrolase
VASLLVLWDVDYTLADTDGVGRHLYQVAFTEMFGGQLPRPGSMAGRTDRAIALEVLTLAGVPDPAGQVRAFEALLAAHAPEMADLARARGRALPGAARAMAALAGLSGAGGGGARGGGTGDSGAEAGAGGTGDRQGRFCLVQSLLTGNIRPLAEVKLGALGLTDHLDLAVGAYGDASEIRAELVHLARNNAAVAYGRDFAGQATVLVGDTPRDVEAALLTGARAVGVATGSYGVAELAEAGAHAVLADLADTDRAVAAILGTLSP